MWTPYIVTVHTNPDDFFSVLLSVNTETSPEKPRNVRLQTNPYPRDFGDLKPEGRKALKWDYAVYCMQWIVLDFGILPLWRPFPKCSAIGKCAILAPFKSGRQAELDNKCVFQISVDGALCVLAAADRWNPS